MTTPKIKAVIVSENQRLSCLPKYFGKQMISAEQGIYNTLSKLCTNYKGAFWNFYELDNGGFYMAPCLDEKFEIFVEGNGYEGILSADAVGIVATLCVINHLCWLDKAEKMINQYYLLRDFAAEHSEANEIYSAID